MPLPAQDHAAILDLSGRYAHAVDLGDPDGWASCFTSDGSFEAPGQTTRGTEELRKFADGMKSLPAPFRHLPSNLVIDGEGDRASMISYVTVLRVESPPRIVFLGRYEDQLEKVDGVWKFARRKVLIDWSER